MLGDLAATGDLRPGRVNLSWSWACAEGEDHPAHQLLRGRHTFPDEVPAQSELLTDGADLFGADHSARRVVQLSYLAAPAVPGPLVAVARLTLELSVAGQPPTQALTVWYTDPATGVSTTDRTDNVTAFDRTAEASDGWVATEVLIVHDGGAEPAGILTIRTGPVKQGAGNQWEWRPRGGAAPIRLQSRNATADRARLARGCPGLRRT